MAALCFVHVLSQDQYRTQIDTMRLSCKSRKQSHKLHLFVKVIFQLFNEVVKRFGNKFVTPAETIRSITLFRRCNTFS